VFASTSLLSQAFTRLARPNFVIQVKSLRLYFSPAAPTFAARFWDHSQDEIAITLESRLLESDARSALAVLTSLEAYFRIDFDWRCRQRLKDELSVHFREIEKKQSRPGVSLDEILEGWKRHSSVSTGLIGQLQGAFNFRHYLAHGRYWSPKLGQKI
jgi:hypothetical protein